jgi:hypothetical protein
MWARHLEIFIFLVSHSTDFAGSGGSASALNLEVTGSSLGRNTEILTEISSSFPQTLQENIAEWIRDKLRQVYPGIVSSILHPIHCLPITIQARCYKYLVSWRHSVRNSAGSELHFPDYYYYYYYWWGGTESLGICSSP